MQFVQQQIVRLVPAASSLHLSWDEDWCGATLLLFRGEREPREAEEI